MWQHTISSLQHANDKTISSFQHANDKIAMLSGGTMGKW